MLKREVCATCLFHNPPVEKLGSISTIVWKDNKPFFDYLFYNDWKNGVVYCPVIGAKPVCINGVRPEQCLFAKEQDL